MIKKLDDMDFKDKKVLVRVDYNVPLEEDGSIADDTRIKASIPTLKHLLVNDAKQIILMTHVGRPEGAVVENLKTTNIAHRLSELLDLDVGKVDFCVDGQLPSSKVVLLENLRFYPQEEANDDVFSKKLASYADVYVNDAFGTAHRAHASTVGVTKYLDGCVGRLIEKELKFLSLKECKRPFVVVLGGAKLKTKLEFLELFLQKADYVLLGGAMMFTFYKSKHFEIGSSLVDDEHLAMAEKLYDHEKLVLPLDVVCATNPDVSSHVVSYDNIPPDEKGLDIGPKTVEKFKEILSSAQTIVWNGPMGFIEHEPFDKGTKEIVSFMSELTKKGCMTIVGGGDSIEIVNDMNLASSFTHVSTGGGASMTLLEGKKLLALEALDK